MNFFFLSTRSLNDYAIGDVVMFVKYVPRCLADDKRYFSVDADRYKCTECATAKREREHREINRLPLFLPHRSFTVFARKNAPSTPSANELRLLRRNVGNWAGNLDGGKFARVLSCMYCEIEGLFPVQAHVID